MSTTHGDPRGAAAQHTFSVPTDRDVLARDSAPDPMAVRDAVLAVPGVLEMHTGPHGTAATFSAGGRIWGVRMDPERIDVHLVGESGRELTDLGRRVQNAVRGALDDYPGRIVVHIEDISVAQPTTLPHQIDPSAAVVGHTEQPRRIP